MILPLNNETMDYPLGFASTYIRGRKRDRESNWITSLATAYMAWVSEINKETEKQTT